MKTIVSGYIIERARIKSNCMVDWKYLPILNGEALCLNIESIPLKGPWRCYCSHAFFKKHRNFTVKWWTRTTLWVFSKTVLSLRFSLPPSPKDKSLKGIRRVRSGETLCLFKKRKKRNTEQKLNVRPSTWVWTILPELIGGRVCIPGSRISNLLEMGR